jgi:hypothetical protein
LLLNAKWSPPDSHHSSNNGKNKSKGDSSTNPSLNSNELDSDSDSEDIDDESELMNKEQITMENIQQRAHDTPETLEEVFYYAACTADMSFRSGIQITVTTQ